MYIPQYFDFHFWWGNLRAGFSKWFATAWLEAIDHNLVARCHNFSGSPPLSLCFEKLTTIIQAAGGALQTTTVSFRIFIMSTRNQSVWEWWDLCRNWRHNFERTKTYLYVDFCVVSLTIFKIFSISWSTWSMPQQICTEDQSSFGADIVFWNSILHGNPLKKITFKPFRKYISSGPLPVGCT